jgi:hypothetical protein
MVLLTNNLKLFKCLVAKLELFIVIVKIEYLLTAASWRNVEKILEHFCSDL